MKKLFLTKTHDYSEHSTWSEFATILIDERIKTLLFKGITQLAEARKNGLNLHDLRIFASSVKFFAAPTTDDYKTSLEDDGESYESLLIQHHEDVSTKELHAQQYNELEVLPDLRTETEMIHISTNHFHFTAVVKHTDELLATEPIYFEQIGLAPLSEPEKHQMVVAFGEDLVRNIAEGTDPKDMDFSGSFTIKEFSSREAMDAYSEALSDSDGWNENYILDIDEETKYSKFIGS